MTLLHKPIEKYVMQHYDMYFYFLRFNRIWVFSKFNAIKLLIQEK